jgi:hypothetical protein
MTADDNDRWMLSYYRVSEINGALFFGRVARIMRPGFLQRQVTHHFADEAAHSSYWTSCMEDLGFYPEKQRAAYQDQYFTALGVPANLMEVMAITLVFEKRVASHYRRSCSMSDGTSSTCGKPWTRWAPGTARTSSAARWSATRRRTGTSTPRR